MQWLGGAQGANHGSFLIPTVAGSSVVDPTWMRVPAGVFDSINEVVVPSDWTHIRSIISAAITVEFTAMSAPASIVVGMGLIAWDGVSDTPPDAQDAPFPVQTSGFDWLWWWTQPMTRTVQNGEVFTFTNQISDGMIFTRGMRKFSGGTGLLLVAEVLAFTSGMSGIWGYDCEVRGAYKQP